jgi:hypothetical protein
MGKCKSCGKEVLFGTTKEGKVVALDPDPAVYKDVSNIDAINRGEMLVERTFKSFVNHLTVCQNPEENHA